MPAALSRVWTQPVTCQLTGMGVPHGPSQLEEGLQQGGLYAALSVCHTQRALSQQWLQFHGQNHACDKDNSQGDTDSHRNHHGRRRQCVHHKGTATGRAGRNTELDSEGERGSVSLKTFQEAEQHED